MNTSTRRAIPSVEKLVLALGEMELPRPLVVGVARHVVASLRKENDVPTFDAIVEQLRGAIDDVRLTRLQPVINGTGVLIHTNLGRAPVAANALSAVAEVAGSYSNLELDLISGSRGKRADYLEQCLALICRAESATVVNNCAAALVLILRHFTKTKPNVIISRGELIQIGGGFRIPEILEASGARLREVGTTNRTTIDDYAEAIDATTAMILKVHRSNFFMRGFVDSPDAAALAQLARKRRIPFVEDLGSGAIVDLNPRERTPAESIRAGIDVVCFSGDKLLGGPQAGVIAGRRRFVAALKREPFFRALRCDKLVLTALQTTAEQYLSGREAELPLIAMMRITPEQLRLRAERIVAQAGNQHVAIVACESQLGGGTLPEASIPSIALELPAELGAKFRRRVPPIVGYISRGKLKLDVRTVFPSQDGDIIAALRE